ncbi:Glycosyltransferase involved in cell wall bisynthesis [Palleronia marisminoris]|uniref:Putative glycosyltransferase EpsE n=1 Tax=Palleronia marisminoris TaxID=315423 RepID=A0A1Y5TX44_9RHOB|nr:glycosyltransferase family A protein [Palleronia marisminoris]SFH50515.1 Glycosyltransferase involved in cell wall bisynthesis [Palleronia marisminoris]SLN70454.1 Putative glycosyltransferase EpsE [Palleronia marisminoris]
MPQTEIATPVKTNEPLVTCVIIFLNGERFIAEAIESVLAQTYENWELVLVDDGTTDGATAIAKDYARRHPDRIRYTEHENHENRGMSASRNAGLRLGRGEYVAFLDADDVWLPDRLKVHVEVLERMPAAAMSVAPTLLWSSWDKTLPRYRPWLSKDMRTLVDVPVGRLLPDPVVARQYLEGHGANLAAIHSITIRREKLLAIGGFDDTFRRLYEDQVMIFKMLLNYPAVAIDQVLDRYRQHPDSATRQDGGTIGDAGMRPIFLEWLQTYMIRQGITDPDLWRALRGEMFRFDDPKAWNRANPFNAFVNRWGAETRLAVIYILTPKVYHRLRRMAGLKPLGVDQA